LRRRPTPIPVSNVTAFPVIVEYRRTEGAVGSSKPPIDPDPFADRAIRPGIPQSGHSHRDAPGTHRATGYAVVVKLNDRGSGRVVDILTRAPLPINVRGLPVKLGISPASVGKLLVSLEREDLLVRGEDGLVIDVRRRALVQAWSEDYSYVRSNRRMGWFIAPRGLPTLFRHLDRKEPMAVTGSLAARRALPAALANSMTLRLAALFTPDPAGLAARLGLIKVGPETANVVIAAPFDPILLTGGAVVDGIRGVTIGRALVDLLTLPEPSANEATTVMDHLSTVDPSWHD
jgi:hypothetical protein